METNAVAVADHLVGEHGGAEDVAVEGVEALGVLGEHGHVVDARQQHGSIVRGVCDRVPFPCVDATASRTRPRSRLASLLRKDIRKAHGAPKCAVS